MEIRRYLGNNTQEAMLKLKMDLGNEAVILNTRKVRRKGILNIFAKPMIEVLAAVDEYANKLKNDAAKKNIKETAISQDTKEHVEFSQTKTKSVLDQKDIANISNLEIKVNSMESILNKVYDFLQFNNQRNDVAKQQEDKFSSKSGLLQIFYNNLLKNEVDEAFAKEIIDTVSKRVKESSDINDTASVLYNVISNMLGKPHTIQLRQDNKPTIVIFVGPTGVGKTTTLAKIAANLSLNLKKNVGLITADTYRIAAVEQLKTYAEILGLPVEVVYSTNEMKDAINVYNDKDIIFVDTAGISSKNNSQLNELKSLLETTCADEVFLVLSTTTSINNLKEILNNYKFLEEYKLIFTKLDETPICGIILNTKQLTNKPLSYITTGQSVPDDIELINIDKTIKNLMGRLS